MTKTIQSPQLSISCSQNQNRHRSVKVTKSNKSGFVSAETWINKRQEARSRLLNEGVIMSRQEERVIDQAIAAASWPMEETFDLPGWVGSQFALGSGEVFSPPGETPIAVTFDRLTGSWETAGTLQSYDKNILHLCSKQRVLQFVLGIAFLPPILSLLGVEDNPIFDLYGPTSTGKSTALYLAASVWGPTTGDGERFWSTWNTTTNSLEREMALHSGGLMVLDESNAFTSANGASIRHGTVAQVVFSLAQGFERSRLTSHNRPRRKAFAVLSSSNVALSDNLKWAKADTADAALVRLLSIPAERQYGILSVPPRTKVRPAEFSRTLHDAMARNHGVAGPAFLRALVRDRARSEEELRAKFGGWCRGFLSCPEQLAPRQPSGPPRRLAQSSPLLSLRANMMFYQLAGAAEQS